MTDGYFMVEITVRLRSYGDADKHAAKLVDAVKAVLHDSIGECEVSYHMPHHHDIALD